MTTHPHATETTVGFSVLAIDDLSVAFAPLPIRKGLFVHVLRRAGAVGALNRNQRAAPVFHFVG